MQQSIEAITQSILQGSQLKRGDDYSFLLETDLSELCTQANRLRQHFCGNQVDLCTIINGKSGRCSEDCKFCAQSSHNHSGCSEYGFLDADTIAVDAKKNASQGVHRYSIVTAGRKLSDTDMEKALAAYRKLHQECSLSLCASHGFLSYEQFLALKEAGVNRYHENIETSQRYFPCICTTHSYQDKIDSIRLAQKAGLEVCSGGIIGMGETWEDRIDMALSLSELGIFSIPINALSPIPGTPFENREPLSNGVPGIGLKALMGMKSPSWEKLSAMSIRSSQVSPIPMMPPEQTSSPLFAPNGWSRFCLDGELKCGKIPLGGFDIFVIAVDAQLLLKLKILRLKNRGKRRERANIPGVASGKQLRLFSVSPDSESFPSTFLDRIAVYSLGSVLSRLPQSLIRIQKSIFGAAGMIVGGLSTEFAVLTASAAFAIDDGTQST